MDPNKYYRRCVSGRSGGEPRSVAARCWICASVAIWFSGLRTSALAQDVETNAPPVSFSQTPVLPPFGANQDQPSSAAGYPGMAPPAPLAGTSQLAGPPPATTSPSLGQAPLNWGFVHFFPHVFYQFSYGNGLQSSPGQLSDTMINQVSPGILLKLGSHWSLDYTPTLRFYSSSSFKDGIDNYVNLNGSTTYQDWTLGLSQSYSSASQPLIETGAQTDQETFLTGLSAAYQMNSKMSLNLAVNQSFRFLNQTVASELLNDSREWSTLDWLNYQFAPRFGAGIGAGFAYDNVSAGSDMTSEQLEGRITWQISHKLSFQLSGGVDYRQFLGSNAPNLLSPIFSGSAQYHLFDPTTLTLTASRTVSPAYFQSQASDSAMVSAGLNQRLLGRLYLAASGGYTTITYHDTTGSQSGPLSDQTITSFNLSLGTTILKRVSASVFYQRTYVSSSGGTSSAFLNNSSTRQEGFSLGYQF